MTRFNIATKNNSGAVQDYKLLAALPEVTGGCDSEVWSNVFQTANRIPNGATAVLSMSKQYYGIIGTIKGGQAEGSMVQASQTDPVTLGELGDDGKLNYGTTLIVDVAGDIQPYFKSGDDYWSPQGYDHCFAIATEPSFTISNTRNRLAVAVDDENGSAPVASLILEPGTMYQIRPSEKYYIGFGGRFKPGQIS